MRRTVWGIEGSVDVMAKLAAGGYSANQIARQLSHQYGLDVSRNAVIGKMMRLGLDLLGMPKRKDDRERKLAKKPGLKLVPTPRQRPAKPAHQKNLNEPAPSGDVDTGCRWLHSDDPRERNFCGAEQRERSAYCQHHHARCFNEVPASRKFEKFSKHASTRMV